MALVQLSWCGDEEFHVARLPACSLKPLGFSISVTGKPVFPTPFSGSTPITVPVENKTTSHQGRLFCFVDTAGKMLNQLKTYLGRFWDFYQTSQSMQKLLENA